MRGDGLDRHDEDLLGFVAAHEMVVAEQGAALLNLALDEVETRLDRLRTRGLVSRRRFSGRSPAVHRITPEGSALVDASLPVLDGFDVQRYRHQLGVAWIWVAARHEAFGPTRAVLSFREMVAADVSLRSGGFLRAPGATLVTDGEGDLPIADVHHPDLALVVPQDVWVAVYLVITDPHPGRLEPALIRYGKDPRLAMIIFLVDEKDRFGPPIRALANRLGLSEDKIRIQGILDIDGG